MILPHRVTENKSRPICIFPSIILTVMLAACGSDGGGGSSDTMQIRNDGVNNGSGSDVGDGSGLGNESEDEIQQAELGQRLSQGQSVGSTPFELWVCQDGEDDEDAYAFFEPGTGSDTRTGLEVDLRSQASDDTEIAFPFTWEVNGPAAILISYDNRDRQDDINSITFDSDNRFRAFSNRQGSIDCIRTLFDNSNAIRLENASTSNEDGTSTIETVWNCSNQGGGSNRYAFVRTQTNNRRIGRLFQDTANFDFEWDSSASDSNNPFIFDLINITYDGGSTERFESVEFSSNDTRFSADSDQQGQISCVLGNI